MVATHEVAGLVEKVQCVVIGAGPAGLAAAACLQRAGIQACVLEKQDSVAHAWRHHYDRLHLHTVKKHSELPHLGFDEEIPRYPSRDQLVAYLERYAAHFDIHPRFGVEVSRVHRENGIWRIETPTGVFSTPFVVIATGYNRIPNRPRFPGDESFPGDILHSLDYRNGAPFQGKRAIVVGCGNSGAEIALDLHEHGAIPSLVVRSPIWVTPRDLFGVFPSQPTSIRLNRLPLAFADGIAKTVLGLVVGDLSRYGIHRPRMGPNRQILTRGRVPMLDVGTLALIKQGEIQVMPAIDRFDGATIHFVDGRSADFDAVVLATGYHSGLSAFLDDADERLNERGLPTRFGGHGVEDGLYFIGFRNPPTGALREAGIEARSIAESIACNSA